MYIKNPVKSVYLQAFKQTKTKQENVQPMHNAKLAILTKKDVYALHFDNKHTKVYWPSAKASKNISQFYTYNIKKKNKQPNQKNNNTKLDLTSVLFWQEK